MNHQAVPTCPICQQDNVNDFFQVEEIPTQDGILLSSKEQAEKAPTGNIELVFCKACHYIYNRAYEPEKIDFTKYEMAMHYSSMYQEFNKKLLNILINDFKLSNKVILDAGCGKGHFLVELCQLGNNTGIGIDPSYENSDNLEFNPNQINFIKEYYNEAQSEHKADFIMCRHVVDELDDPLAFIKLFNNNLKEIDPIGIYVEVPNALNTFENKLTWNIGYAKRSWFTPESITQIYKEAGFEVVRIEPFLKGNYMGVFGKPISKNYSYQVDDQKQSARIKSFTEFSEAFDKGLAKWKSLIEEWTQKGSKVALWGAGMRAINFLSVFPDHDLISLVIDINPHRQNKFLPRSGFLVGAPENLQNQAIDVLIISNPTYQQEIKDHAISLGYKGEFEIL